MPYMAVPKFDVVGKAKEQKSVYRPNESEGELLRYVFKRFKDMQEQRQREYRILNNRSLETYWKDSEERWLSYIPPRRRKEWQAKVVRPVTRNRCIGIIALLLQGMMEPNVFAELDGENVEEVALAINDLLDLSQELDRYELKYLLTLVDAVSLGTAFLSEDYVVLEREVKEVTSWDPSTGKVEFTKKKIEDFNGMQSSVVSPWELYLGNIFEFDLQKQPDMIRRTVMPFEQAKAEFGHLPGFSNVVPGFGQQEQTTEEDFFYQAQDVRDMRGDDVEVIRYFNRGQDLMALILNGVLLTQVDMPFPYAHKKYPFSKTVFEVLTPRFAYGKSLPDKMQGEQDVIDTLYRMIIDKTFISIFPPLLAKGNEKVNADIIFPAKITPVASETEVTSIAGLTNGVGNEINVLSMIESSMNQSSVHPQLLGTPAGGERSATQVMETRRGAEQLLGLFGYMIAFLIEDHGDLRIQNILQFWARYEPLLDSRSGRSNQVRGLFEARDKVLKNGKTGTRQIRFLPVELAPSSEALRQQELAMAEQGKNIQFVYLDPARLRDYKTYLRVKASPQDRLTPALKKALGLEFYDRFIQNPFVSAEKLTRDTVRLFDKNPDEVMKSAQEVQAAQQQQAMAGEQEEEKPQTQKMGNLTSKFAAMQQPEMEALLQEPMTV